MTLFHWLLAAALCLQWYNMGTIWFCQTTVYPLFAKVGRDQYVIYHKSYTGSILISVIIPGFLSFVMPVGLLILRPDVVPAILVWGNLIAGLVGLWVTVRLEIPRHNQLERGKEDTVIAELIRYNWPRTLSITASAVMTTAIAACAFAPV